jgi:hypothetical protein
MSKIRVFPSNRLAVIATRRDRRRRSSCLAFAPTLRQLSAVEQTFIQLCRVCNGLKGTKWHSRPGAIAGLLPFTHLHSREHRGTTRCVPVERGRVRHVFATFLYAIGFVSGFVVPGPSRPERWCRPSKVITVLLMSLLAAQAMVGALLPIPRQSISSTTPALRDERRS